jgi:hypothetical protein
MKKMHEENESLKRRNGELLFKVSELENRMENSEKNKQLELLEECSKVA